MRAVIQVATGKALLVLGGTIVELSAMTAALSTTHVAVWGRGRHFRAARALRDMPC
jgi:hypothetical protein